MGACSTFEHRQGGLAPVFAANEESGSLTDQLSIMHRHDNLDLKDLLRYYRLVSTAPSKILSDEFELTKKEFATKRNARTQWQMAILLSLPEASFYDAGRSTTLFKELTNADIERSAALNDAAFLMYSLTNAHQQIAQKAENLSSQLSEANSINKTLQDQLNALKAIENTLYERNKAEVKPKP